MKMKIKRVATLALSLLMLVLCMTPACFAVAQKEKYGILSLVSDGISITARVSDIERWVNAKSDDEKATVEAELLSNPNNKIEPITNNLFVKVNSVDDAGECDEVYATPSMERRPGKWTISEHVVKAGGVVKHSRAGGEAFDVAYDESVHLHLAFAGTRVISAACSPSYPDKFYDPESWDYSVEHYFGKMDSGQYYVYVKNWSADDMTVFPTSYIEIYE